MTIRLIEDIDTTLWFWKKALKETLTETLRTRRNAPLRKKFGDHLFREFNEEQMLVQRLREKGLIVFEPHTFLSGEEIFSFSYERLSIEVPSPVVVTVNHDIPLVERILEKTFTEIRDNSLVRYGGEKTSQEYFAAQGDKFLIRLHRKRFNDYIDGARALASAFSDQRRGTKRYLCELFKDEEAAQVSTREDADRAFKRITDGMERSGYIPADLSQLLELPRTYHYQYPLVGLAGWNDSKTAEYPYQVPIALGDVGRRRIMDTSVYHTKGDPFARFVGVREISSNEPEKEADPIKLMSNESEVQ